MKISQDKAAAAAFPDIHLVTSVKGCDRIILEPLGEIGWAGNSGFHANNLAVQFGRGPRKIILVGFDMKLEAGAHWHGKHPEGLKNPTDRNIVRWRRALDEAAPIFAAIGVKVINTSPISALTNYPKMTIQEALECPI